MSEQVSAFQIVHLTKGDREQVKVFAYARYHQQKMARYVYWLTGRLMGRW